MKRLFFDTETTGLVKNSATPLDQQPQIIEFYGMIQSEVGKTIECYHSLFRVGRMLPPKITEITSITDEMLEGQPTFKQEAENLARFIEQADLVVAHNLSFDTAMVNFEMKRAWPGNGFTWPDGMCTVEASEHLKGHRLSLALLHEHLFGEKFTGAHRADVDVKALARCYWKLVEMGEV